MLELYVHHHPFHVATKVLRDFETLLYTAISHAVVPLFAPPYRVDDHSSKQQFGIASTRPTGVQAFTDGFRLATGSD